MEESKFSLLSPKFFFRESSYLITSLFSNNVAFTKFLSVLKLHIALWKLREFTALPRIFGKNFVKVTVLLKKLLNKCFDEKFFSGMGVNFRNFHSVNCFPRTAQCKKREVLSHSMKKKSSYPLFST